MKSPAMRIPGAICLLLLAAACVFQCALSAAGPSSRSDPVPAVVLGHYPADVDAPTSVQTARCMAALNLFKEGRADRIVVTGGFTRGHISEARMMKIALVAYGVPEKAVFEEERSSTTIENAKFSALLFDRLGWEKKALLVSQKGHLWRAEYNFKDAGFRVKQAAAAEAPAAADFDNVLNSAGQPDERLKSLPPVDTVVIYERYASDASVDFPDAGMSARMRAAAFLYRTGKAGKVLVSSDWYTRGPVDISEIMRIGLVSFGVKAEDIIADKKARYSSLAEFMKKFKSSKVVLITSPEPGGAAPDGMPPDLNILLY